MERLTPMSSHIPREDAATIAAQLSQLTDAMERLAAQQQQILDNHHRIVEAWREAAPILKDVVGAGAVQLGALETRGYFRAGRAALGVLDRVVAAYSEEDLLRFSDAAVSILDTVRSLTQPEILAIASEASAALTHADTLAPLGMGGVLRASREAEVQRGMAVFLEVLRHVGRASTHLQHDGAPAPAARVAAAPAAAPRPAAAAASCGTGMAAPSASQEEVVFMGARFTGDGTLLEPEKWSRELAVALAGTVGVEELTADHWAVIDFARREFAETSHSPNIRRLTEGVGIDTRRLYALFPQAPGRAVARVAGLPKPAGCI